MNKIENLGILFQVFPLLEGVCLQVTNSQHDMILSDGCRALQFLSDGPNERIQPLVDSGILRRLVQLLLHSNTTVR